MPTTVDTDVLVVGAGVSGLTTALIIAQQGLRVRVVASQKPVDSTSAVAGAIWGPYLANDPRIMPWSLEALCQFERLAVDSTSGVRMTRGVEAAIDHVSTPDWMRRLPDFQPLDKTSLPAGYKTGWRYRVPIVDMPVYLDHLIGELLRRNVKVEFLARPLARLDDAGAARLAIVNCTGLGAEEIVPDPTMIPMWGQLVVVDNPGITDFFADHGESDEPVYFMPQGDQVVLGGVVYAGHGPSEPDLAVSRGIVARCAGVEPRLATATIRAHRIGVRPGRAEVRLERERRVGGAPVIHNYGHGGSGVTVSWGCAMDVLRLIQTV